jgi:hypothetical protein
MNNNRNAVIGWVVVIIVIILILISFYYSRQANVSDQSNTTVTQNTPSPTPSPIQTINVKHQFKAGIHTYAGSIDFPTPCQSLTTVASANPNSPGNYILSFTTTGANSTCAQVVTTRPFKVSFTAPVSAKIIGTLDGNPVRLNIFEVGANDNLDTYNINIKG